MHYVPMRRSIWAIAICVLCVFSTNIGRAEAQVINEIFYSPASKQWIEIYNSTDSDIDFSQYKILDNGASVNGHAISAAQAGGSTILPAHEYGVVAKDVGSVTSGFIFKSSLGIKTTGDTVSLKKGSGVIDTAQFADNAAESGKSIQKFDSGWSASAPTPGLVNVLGQVNDSTGPESTSTATTTDSESTEQTTNTPVSWSSHYSFVAAQNDTTLKLSVSAGRERLASTKESIHFKAVLNTNDPNALYEWNFGDGTVDKGKEVDHVYILPGDYVIVLNVKLFDNEAVSRTKVKVVEPDIMIGEVTPDYVSVRNNSIFEINLYGWQITENGSSFSIPRDTIITPKNIVKFSRFNIGLKTPGIASINRIIDNGEVLGVSTSSAVAHAEDNGQRVEQIQAISDRLIALNEQLKEMVGVENKRPAQQVKPDSVKNSAAAITSIPPVVATIAASATSTAKSEPWYKVVKRFFLGTK